jgi:hypothetical protein
MWPSLVSMLPNMLMASEESHITSTPMINECITFAIRNYRFTSTIVDRISTSIGPQSNGSIILQYHNLAHLTLSIRFVISSSYAHCDCVIILKFSHHCLDSNSYTIHHYPSPKQGRVLIYLYHQDYLLSSCVDHFVFPVICVY